jgi:hypothetical protein
MRRAIVHGPALVEAELPDDTEVVSPGLALPLPPTEDLSTEIARALDEPLDGPPLKERVRHGMRVLVAFDDPTVPCYAPLWATALPLIVDALAAGGIAETDISLLCANSLHRRFTHNELARTIGPELVARFRDRLTCHDGEDPDGLEHLGTTASGYDVVLSKRAVEADLVVYLNCSTTRGFSGGWKSICVGLSSYQSIRHHHTPDTMSMSLDRNRMHEMLDEMGALTERRLGADRFFKLETVLSDPLQVHRIFSGSVGAARRAALDAQRAHLPARRDLLRDKADVVVYGVPDWSPYAAFSHTNPVLDLISTGLGYLGGMIEAAGRPGCTVVLATPCPLRFNLDHHPAYAEAWEELLPVTDVEQTRRLYEHDYATRADHIERYRFGNAFHPVHAVMALYPLKRLRHAGRVIVAAPDDPAVPARIGFDSEPTVERAVAAARADHGPDARVVLVDYPLVFNRS